MAAPAVVPCLLEEKVAMEVEPVEGDAMVEAVEVEAVEMEAVEVAAMEVEAMGVEAVEVAPAFE